MKWLNTFFDHRTEYWHNNAVYHDGGEDEVLFDGIDHKLTLILKKRKYDPSTTIRNSISFLRYYYRLRLAMLVVGLPFKKGKLLTKEDYDRITNGPFIPPEY